MPDAARLNPSAFLFRSRSSTMDRLGRAALRVAPLAATAAVALAAWCMTGIARADVPGARAAVARGECQVAGDAINEGLGRNDAEAYFLAGFLYDQGACVAGDPVRAARLYEKAAALGNADAKTSLGLMTGLGRGVPQDYAAAHRLFHADKPAACDAGATPETLAALGYAETVSRLAWRKVAYPTTANEKGLEATLDVVLTPADGKVELAHVRVDAETGSNLPRTRDFTNPIETAYRDAIAQAPRPTATPDPALRIVAPWHFTAPRDAYNRKVRLEGIVSLDDVCPIH